jgi:hypothetical protein
MHPVTYTDILEITCVLLYCYMHTWHTNIHYYHSHILPFNKSFIRLYTHYYDHYFYYHTTAVWRDCDVVRCPPSVLCWQLLSLLVASLIYITIITIHVNLNIAMADPRRTIIPSQQLVVLIIILLNIVSIVFIASSLSGASDDAAPSSREHADTQSDTTSNALSTTSSDTLSTAHSSGDPDAS